MVDIKGMLFMILRVVCYCSLIWVCNILLIVLDLLVKYFAGPKEKIPPLETQLPKGLVTI
jgi:hypothetical protein